MQPNLISIREWLQQELLSSLDFSALSEKFHLAKTEISLYRLKNNSVIVYRSAIAFQLSRHLSRSPLDISQEILSKLMPRRSQLKGEVTPPGFLDFGISDRYLSQWLQSLIAAQNEISFPSNVPQTQKGKRDFFELQYAHARSCSLLRFGDRQGLIQRNAAGKWITPSTIPWLNTDFDPARLRLKHPAEQDLIAELLTIIDSLSSASREDWEKFATGLGKAVLDVERHCRIWGEVAQDSPELVQARLGLIAIAQFLLRELLQVQMGIFAPLEL